MVSNIEMSCFRKVRRRSDALGENPFSMVA